MRIVSIGFVASRSPGSSSSACASTASAAVPSTVAAPAATGATFGAAADSGAARGGAMRCVRAGAATSAIRSMSSGSMSGGGGAAARTGAGAGAFRAGPKSLSSAAKMSSSNGSGSVLLPCAGIARLTSCWRNRPCAWSLIGTAPAGLSVPRKASSALAP